MVTFSVVREGIALLDTGLSPYSGDIFHEPPLVLLLFQFLLAAGESVVGLFFVVRTSTVRWELSLGIADCSIQYTCTF